MIAAMEIGLAHVYRYSRRDQLSAPFAFAQAGLSPYILNIDNHGSKFHSWPHVATRNESLRIWPSNPDGAGVNPQSPSLEQSLADLRDENAEIKRRFNNLSHEHVVLLQSTSWRVTAPLRLLMNCFKA